MMQYYISLYYKKDIVTGANKRFDKIGNNLKDKKNIKFIVTEGNKPYWANDSQIIYIKGFTSIFTRVISFIQLNFLLLSLPKGSVYSDFLPTPFIGLLKHNHYQLIHDLRNFTEFERNTAGILTSKIQKLQLIMSKNIVTVSQQTKDELVHFCNLNPQKIHVSYNGIDNVEGKNINLTRDIDLLYIATFEERKNHITLLKALALFPVDRLSELKIMFVGRDLGVKDYIIQSASDFGVNIEFISDVSDAELTDIYKRTKLFISPSLYEGFGMPLIEAMQFDCSIACSDIRVFQEVCAEYATYFDPLSSDDIYQTIKAILVTPNSHNYKNHLESFYWDNISNDLYVMLENRKSN